MEPSHPELIARAERMLFALVLERRAQLRNRSRRFRSNQRCGRVDSVRVYQSFASLFFTDFVITLN
jgi:hypothetical protein